jgi:hypothetical protein
MMAPAREAPTSPRRAASEVAEPAPAARWRALATLAGLPEPLSAQVVEDDAGGERRLLLRLPDGGAGADPATRVRRLLLPGPSSPLLLGPLAVEAAPGALGAVYALPPAPRRGELARPLPATLADLLAAAASVPCAQPELLALLVLAGCLAALRDLHGGGGVHGLLAPGWVLLAGAAPARLLSECPRDPAVRLFGCGVAAGLDPVALRRAREASGRFLAPELDPRRAAASARPPADLGGAAAADLWGAAALTRALLATQVVEPPAEADPDGVAARLERLLASLQAHDPARRPSAALAAALCRELAIRALADWEGRREPCGAEVRYAAPTRRHRAGGGVGQRGVRAGDRRVSSPPGCEASWETRPVALARERSDARPDPLPGVPALAAAEPAGGFADARASWLALVPFLLAGLLSLLLAVTLLLGT